MGAIDPRYPPLPRPVTIENLTDEELAALTRAQIDRLGTPHEGPCDWRFWARDEQMAPSGDWAIIEINGVPAPAPAPHSDARGTALRNKR